MTTLYAFIDESGNDDFSPRGTRYWSLTSLLMTDPTTASEKLLALRHELIEQHDLDLPRFHASEDRQAVRDRVFSILAGLNVTSATAHAVVRDKRITPPEARTADRYYSRAIAETLRTQLNTLEIDDFERLVVMIDRPTQKGGAFQSLEKAVKQAIPDVVGDLPYRLLFHRSESHHGLQMVDYISWAIYVMFERNEARPYEFIRHLLLQEPNLSISM